MPSRFYIHDGSSVREFLPPKLKPRTEIIGTDMESKIHPVTGRRHTYTTGFRRDTKAAGCVEVGNDPSYIDPQPRKMMDAPGLLQDVIDSYNEVQDAARRRR